MCDGSPGVENERIMMTPIVKLRSSRETPTFMTLGPAVLS